VIYSENCPPSHPTLLLKAFPAFQLQQPAQSCDGLGTILEFDPDLIVPDKSRPRRWSYRPAAKAANK
jgi:hypothetical protein